MTMTEVWEVFRDAGLNANSTPYGVEWATLRVSSGSGIAGRGGIWAITFPGYPELDPITGIHTKAQLRKALRDLIIACVRRGLALRDLMGSEVLPSENT
jgi:hypothetical protein